MSKFFWPEDVPSSKEPERPMTRVCPPSLKSDHEELEFRHDGGPDQEGIMRKSKYSEEQIIGALKRAEQGVAAKDI